MGSGNSVPINREVYKCCLEPKGPKAAWIFACLLASAGVGGEKRVSGLEASSILLFSPVAVVRLMVGKLRVGICGDGGRKVGN